MAAGFSAVFVGTAVAMLVAAALAAASIRGDKSTLMPDHETAVVA